MTRRRRRGRPGLDTRFERALFPALAKKPLDRFPTMQAFADALTGLDLPQPTLTLRVLGTPFSYRPLPGQTLISVGRQRRKPGDPDDAGNDMVLRVPGDDARSARISRRHFEIQRDGEIYFVTDRSKVGTHLNDRPLGRGLMTPIANGDRLMVAGVIELEVVLDTASASARLARSEVRLPQAGFVVEATLGDMITME